MAVVSVCRSAWGWLCPAQCVEAEDRSSCDPDVSPLRPRGPLFTLSGQSDSAGWSRDAEGAAAGDAS